MGREIDETDWKLIGIIISLVAFIFVISVNMVNASQSSQDNLIQADHQDIIDIKTQVSAIVQHNVDEDKRLERIENKLDILLQRGS